MRVLDGLRGLAIALVVLSHSGQTGYRPELDIGRASIALFPLVVAGSLGVEMFFFLSGFVLFLPYARAMVGEGETPTIGHFIDRRFIKIVPSYYLALLATAYFFLQPSRASRRFQDRFGRSASKSNSTFSFRSSRRACGALPCERTSRCSPSAKAGDSTS